MDTPARRRAAAAAEQLLNDLGISRLPVDVFAIANEIGVPAIEKPDASAGVSGALVKIGSDFVIAYATHIQSNGFRRFSIAHELGHLHIPGHAESLLSPNETLHESRAGYQSENPHEREADEFAANLLMPKHPFETAMHRCGDGLSAILELSDLCETSRLATAIRYVNLTGEALAVVVSEGSTLRYAFLSDELKEFSRISWPRRNSPLPVVPTVEFNQHPKNVVDCRQEEHETSMGDWFGGDHSATLREEIIGLGQYGRTLTVLRSDILADEDDVDRDLEESWRPRFSR